MKWVVIIWQWFCVVTVALNLFFAGLNLYLERLGWAAFSLGAASGLAAVTIWNEHIRRRIRRDQLETEEAIRRAHRYIEMAWLSFPLRSYSRAQQQLDFCWMHDVCPDCGMGVIWIFGAIALCKYEGCKSRFYRDPDTKEWRRIG